MGKGIFLVVIFLILGVSFLIFVLPILGVSLAVNQPKPSPSITILEHSGEVNTHSGTYIVTGTAKNTGTIPVTKVYIVVTTYDENGADLGSTYTALMNLNPGDEVPFRVDARPYYQGIQVARYNIVPNYDMVPDL